MGEKRNSWALAGRYTSLAFLLPATTVVGYAIGYFLDRALGTSFLKAVFLILGIAGGFIKLIQQVQKDMRDSDQ